MECGPGKTGLFVQNLLLCLFGGWMLTAISVDAADLRCSGESVVVHASDPRDAEIVCKGASDAVKFLNSQGLHTCAHLEIHVVETLPDAVPPATAGCYVHAERRVYLLTPARFEQQAMHVAPPSCLDYHSLITHEVAHAIAGCNFAVPKPTIQAHEYVAYLTMLSTMPDAARERMLGNFAGDGFDTEQQITATIYLMAPQWFGAQVYRHYLKPGNGEAFLRKVLAGKALSFDCER